MAVLFVWRLYADAAGEGISPADFLTMEVLCLRGRYPWSFFSVREAVRRLVWDLKTGSPYMKVRRKMHERN